MKGFNAATVISLAALYFAFSGFAWSGTVVLTATNSGWYYDDGSHAGYTEPNIITGVCTACLYSGESRSFFLFDLSGLSEQVVSAELRISTGDTESSYGRLVLMMLMKPFHCLM